MEVLLFSLSISIDALGYSLGFGSKNVTITLRQFFILNLINTLILSLYLQVFSNFEYLFKNPIIAKISPVLMAIFGAYYVIIAFYAKIKANKSTKNNKQKYLNFINYFNNENNKNISKITNLKKYLTMGDLLLLLCVFVFENAFSTFVFYTSFNNVVLFVLTNFIFHFFFFLLGFNLGKKLAIKLNCHTSFVSGYIFLCLAYIELFF